MEGIMKELEKLSLNFKVGQFSSNRERLI